MYLTLFALFNPSYLERTLADIRDECHWLRSVSWELSIRCNLCGGKEDPETGLCTWHDRKGCVHEDCAHYIPLKSRHYSCPDAKGPEKGIIPKEAYEDWFAVSLFVLRSICIPSLLKTVSRKKNSRSPNRSRAYDLSMASSVLERGPRRSQLGH